MKTSFEEAKELLGKESVARYAELLKTSASLAFGGLVFLLAFEKDYAPKAASHYWLVYAAWFVMALSSLAGFYSLVLWAERPDRRLSGVREEVQVHSGKSQTVKVIPKELSRSESWSFKIHMFSFVISVVLLMIYKAAHFYA